MSKSFLLPAIDWSKPFRVCRLMRFGGVEYMPGDVIPPPVGKTGRRRFELLCRLRRLWPLADVPPAEPRIVDLSRGWYQVVDAKGKEISTKALRKHEAEKLLSDYLMETLE